MTAYAIKPQGETAPRQPRIMDRTHLTFVRTLPCIVCGVHGRTEAAHLRFSSPEHGKRETGKAEKPDDCWTTPLCTKHHREQHEMNERDWWEQVGIDPVAVCSCLYAVSGDEDGAREVMKCFRKPSHEIPGGEAAMAQMMGEGEG